MSTTSFPVELWARVAALVDRSDLMNLALVSSLHLAVCRRIFCRKLTLDANRFTQLDSGGQEMHTIRNYIVKYNLHCVVQELVVWGYFTKAALDKLLEVVPSLRSLSMIIAGAQVFLSSSKAQKKFVEHLKTSCPGLQVFRLNAAAHLKDGDFSIPNLKAVKWKEFGRVSPAFISLCRASLLTLTEISLAIYDGAYVEFFRLSFPKLLVFKIGPGDERYGSNTRRAKAISSGLTSFLVARPSIETLDLVYHSVTDINDAIYISLRPKLLTPHMLPNLKTLHAHPTQVSQLAAANVEFLGSLKSLSLSDKPYSTQKHPYDFSGMLDKLAAKGPLFVRHLTCRRPYTREQKKTFAGDMRKLADVFPELETWVGSSPEGLTIEKLSQIFSQFSNIREISYNTLSASSQKYTADDIKIIAGKCPLLESFVWRNTRPPTQFTIMRLHDQIIVNNGLPMVDERKDNHADSDADNDDPRSDDEWWSDDEDDNEDENTNGQEGEGRHGPTEEGDVDDLVDDDDDDMSDGGESGQEGSEDSTDDD